jgi:hypothetical protein
MTMAAAVPTNIPSHPKQPVQLRQYLAKPNFNRGAQQQKSHLINSTLYATHNNDYTCLLMNRNKGRKAVTFSIKTFQYSTNFPRAVMIPTKRWAA